MQSGQSRTVLTPLDLNDVLSRSVEIYSVQAKDKSVELNLHVESGLTVAGDADRLEQVFNNLLDNAIKNSPNGSAVEITGILSRDRIHVSVSDSGNGISPENLPHVFERFYQVPGVRTGVGLGLTIAKEIVSAHGGTIEVHSSPGKGARFTVTLPASSMK